MWTVVYIAQTEETANLLTDLLKKESILVKLRPICKQQSALSNNYYEVLVPESEVGEAHSVIIENGY